MNDWQPLGDRAWIMPLICWGKLTVVFFPEKNTWRPMMDPRTEPAPPLGQRH